MIIYDNNGKILLDIPVDDDSCRYRAIGQAKKVELHYSLPGHLEVPLGSFIEYQGERYTLWSPSGIEKKGTRNLSYKLTLGGEEEVLKMFKYKQLSEKPYKLKFPLTAKPRMFVELLVENLNLYDPGWTVGEVIESAEKPMSFNHENCWSVLGRLAQEFNTEFEIKEKTISLQKLRYFEDSPIKLSYGKGNGFVPGVGRTNQGDNQPVDILYVQGGEKNINNSSYGSKTLLLPKSQELDYEGHMYETDVDGMRITRKDKASSAYNEDSFDASHIYPTRVGVVSEVQMEPGKDSEGKLVTFYNIVDNKIPEALNYRDCRLDGNKATIIFQSGKLTGREFDIEQTDKELTGYDHAKKTFKLVSMQADGLTLPNDISCPSAGDEYAVFNISLPKAYVCDNDTKTGASWEMFREAVRYLREHEERQFTFKGELDGIWARKNWLAVGGKLIPGGYVDFSDTQFQPDGVLIRITGVRDYINKPHSPELELSNSPVSGFLSDSLGKLEAEEVRIDQKNKESISFTKRSFQDAKETMGMLADALLTNFTGSINPIAVATMQMLVGDESLQFRFVNNKTNLVVVPHNVTYNEKSNSLNVPAGIIQHMTLGIKEISPKHDYKFWNVGSYGSPYLEPEKKYYLYARCSESSESGTFLVSDKAIGMGDEAGYYHLLAGVLNSQYGGERSFTSLYGYTEILPGRITTDKIVSTDGKTYFVLNRGDGEGEIGGKITFSAGSSGLDNVKEWPAAKKAIEIAQSTADDAAREIVETNKALSGFETTVNGAFKDGVIEEAEAKAIEKYINTLNTEKADADAVYNKLYANEYLTGAAKTDLSSSKSTYNGAHASLISSVNVAINDGKTTEPEKADVDNKFVSYRSAIADYKTKVEAANKAIQDKLRGYSEAAYQKGADALSKAESASNDANAAMNSANTAQNTANGKAQVFYSVNAPSGAKTNDLWVDGANIYRYDGSSWIYASAYDNTQTKINGGLITTGAIAVGPAGSPTGGISGSGSIRIWAGGGCDSSGKPITPKFQVASDGTVMSQTAITLMNNQAGITGFGTEITSVRFWAGSYFPESAPFRVTQQGEAYISRGNIGRFNIKEGRLTWVQGDYFGGLSRALKLGYGSAREGVVDVVFNAATDGCFGIKSIGRTGGGACVYASSTYLSQSYPSNNNTYAIYAEGASLFKTNSGEYITLDGVPNDVSVDDRKKGRLSWITDDRGRYILCMVLTN